jgi:hypothetical protein
MYGFLEIGESTSHGARPFYYTHLDDPVAWVVNEDRSLCEDQGLDKSG